MEHPLKPDIGCGPPADAHLVEMLHREDAVVAAGGHDPPRRHRPDARDAQQFLVARRINVHRKEPGLFFGNNGLGVVGDAQSAFLIQGEIYFPRGEAVDPESQSV